MVERDEPITKTRTKVRQQKIGLSAHSVRGMGSKAIFTIDTPTM